MDLLKTQRHIWKHISLVYVCIIYTTTFFSNIMFKKIDETLIEYIFADGFTILIKCNKT